MTLRTLTTLTEAPPGVKDVLKELQGLKMDIINGAAAGTKMDVPLLRVEDTIVAAIKQTDAAGAMVTDLANITIQPTKASGTLTVSGNPTADETFVVNGTTYTWKATPTAKTHVKITAGNVTAMAAAVAAAVNAVENSRSTVGNQAVPVLAATSAVGVVTFTATIDGPGNGPAVTETGTTITVDSTDPAAVTATFVSAGNTDAIIITPAGGTAVTFTIKTTPVDADKDMPVLGTDTLQAAEAVRAINAYDLKYGTLDVIASNVAGVVTLAPRTARKGNIITLTENATNVAVSGSGFLAGGTLTGGIKSTTDLSVSSILMLWFDKNP